MHLGPAPNLLNEPASLLNKCSSKLFDYYGNFFVPIGAIMGIAKGCRVISKREDKIFCHNSIFSGRDSSYFYFELEEGVSSCFRVNSYGINWGVIKKEE